MFIAEVVGKLWAIQKSPGLNNKRLLIVDKIDGNPPKRSGERLMAVADRIDAGPGDIVLVLDEGGSARSILNDETAPIRTIIVGIVDFLQIEDKYFSSADVGFSDQENGQKRRSQ